MDKQAADPATTGSERQRHPLARGIEILTLMVDSGEPSYGVRELGGLIGVSASTAHRLLTDLEDLGMVSRTPTGSYRLGMEFLRLAWTANTRFPLREAADDVLAQLTASSGESSFFAIYSEQRQQMMFAVSVESSHPLRYAVPHNVWLPLHAGASGQAILAFLPEDVQDEIINADLEALTERTVIDADKLADRLRQVRESGYALSHGERIDGAIAVAAPVMGPAGVVIGDIGITIPESRFNASTTNNLTSWVVSAAQELTQRFSGTHIPSAAAS